MSDFKPVLPARWFKVDSFKPEKRLSVLIELLKQTKGNSKGIGFITPNLESKELEFHGVVVVHEGFAYFENLEKRKRDKILSLQQMVIGSVKPINEKPHTLILSNCTIGFFLELKHPKILATNVAFEGGIYGPDTELFLDSTSTINGNPVLKAITRLP